MAVKQKIHAGKRQTGLNTCFLTCCLKKEIFIIHTIEKFFLWEYHIIVAF